MSDLIERLRHASEANNYVSEGGLWNLCGEAAEELERLRAENERFREALELIVSDAEFCGDEWGSRSNAWLETARQALSQSTEGV